VAARLEVITANHYWKRIKLLYLICGPFALLGLRLAVQGFENSRSGEGMLMLGIALVMGLSPLVFVVARRWWVQSFDADGVRLRNGRLFRWETFEKVDVRTIGRYRSHNNYELHFSDGIANVYDRMAANHDEIHAVIEELKRGHNRFRAAASQ
jgi:hypothetical protein